MVVDSYRLAIVSELPGHRLLAGLFSLLPLEQRAEFSFTTGLSFSTQRPFRLYCTPVSDRKMRLEFERHDYLVCDVAAFTGAGRVSVTAPACHMVEQILRSGQLHRLNALHAGQIANPSHEVTR
jgi:hypothetical protein